MPELYLLGSASLRKEGGDADHAFFAGSKRVGLLAYLVLSRPRGFQRRDHLLALFWPEHDQQSARNALSNMLYHIRGTVGGEVVANRGLEEVGIPDGRLWCDVTAFEQALDEGRVQEALSIYRGDLLEGFYVPNVAPEFHHWLDRERDRLRTLAAEAAWTLSDEAQQGGNPKAARAWAKQAAGWIPVSDEAHARLIRLLDQTGDRTGALEAYEEFSRRLRQEWNLEPSQELQALADEIRARVSGRAARPVSASDPPASNRSIAVLPFETIGTERATDLTRGIHGDVLTRLANVADFEVISRTSVLRYQASGKTIFQIGRELGATWVVEGEVQEAARQVQVRVRLIDARTDRQVWAIDYGRILTAENIFEIQSEITKRIADALEAQLSPQEKARVEHAPTRNLTAYRLHAQGRRLLEQRTADSMRQAMKYFQQAIDEDPGYPLAWVGLADALTLLYGYAHEKGDAGLTRAEEAARRALELDPDLAEAHASLGALHNCYMDGPAMVRAIQRAVELRHGYAEAHNWLSWAYQQVGQPEEALESAERAVKLDPLSPEAVGNLAFSCLIGGEVERALREARRAIELEPERTGAILYEGLSLCYLGRNQEAIAVLENLSVPWAGSGPQATLALAYVAAGEEERARTLLARFEEVSDHFAAGLVRAAFGEVDQAFQALQHIDDWNGDVRRAMWPTLAIHHLFPDVLGVLRRDPRWQELLTAVNRAWKIGVDAAS